MVFLGDFLRCPAACLHQEDLKALRYCGRKTPILTILSSTSSVGTSVQPSQGYTGLPKQFIFSHTRLVLHRGHTELITGALDKFKPFTGREVTVRTVSLQENNSISQHTAVKISRAMSFNALVHCKPHQLQLGLCPNTHNQK